MSAIFGRVLLHRPASCQVNSLCTKLSASSSNRKSSTSTDSIKLTTFSNDEKKDFVNVFSDLNKQLSFQNLPKDLVPLLGNHVNKCIDYNVPDGKKTRGLSVPYTYKLLVSQDQHTKQNIRLSIILGWTVEFLQAFFLVADDIMDHSETRRGKKCWYKESHIGLTAFNDSILLESFVFSILKQYFGQNSNYADMLDLMHQVVQYTSLGQALDLQSVQIFQENIGSEDCLNHFTMDRYKATVKYKTSYYSFYLPLALAMRLANIKDQNLYVKAEHILLNMGQYFQVQDDFLDCFGDPQVTGKIGTDIQDGKCSWLVVNALQRANQAQKRELAKRYGSSAAEDVEWVKQLYSQLHIVQMFNKYEKDFYQDITSTIQQIKKDELPQQMFTSLLATIYKRNK